MAGKRIIRGFSRAGVWAFVMAVIVGGGLTGIWAEVQNSAATGIDIGLSLTVLAATAALVFFVGLGWVLAGFARD